MNVPPVTVCVYMYAIQCQWMWYMMSIGNKNAHMCWLTPGGRLQEEERKREAVCKTGQYMQIIDSSKF
jgi:hypothetical protein